MYRRRPAIRRRRFIRPGQTTSVTCSSPKKSYRKKSYRKKSGIKRTDQKYVTLKSTSVINVPADASGLYDLCLAISPFNNATSCKGFNTYASMYDAVRLRSMNIKFIPNVTKAQIDTFSQATSPLLASAMATYQSGIDPDSGTILNTTISGDPNLNTMSGVITGDAYKQHTRWYKPTLGKSRFMNTQPTASTDTSLPYFNSIFSSVWMLWSKIPAFAHSYAFGKVVITYNLVFQAQRTKLPTLIGDEDSNAGYYLHGINGDNEVVFLAGTEPVTTGEDD